MTKKRKIGLVLIAICLVLCVAVGSSYAIWKVTNKQTTANNFQSCFQLNYVEDSDAIALDNAFPETDANGLKEKPFTFTLTNVCENEVYYQINLETLLEPTAAATLQDNDLKVAINKKDYTTNSPKVLTDYDRVTTTGLVENAKRAYKIETGALPAHGEVTYNVWEYINDSSDSIAVTNKAHKSKISIMYTSDEKDRNTYLYSAPETCFNFDSASGEIVGYYSHEDNDPSKDACPMNVVIPSVIDGHTVTKLGGYLFNGLGFTAIEIPNTITSIGAYALANNNIKDVVIPDSVTSIGNYSFAYSNVETVKISNILSSIPEGAFHSNKLSNVVIPASVISIDWEAFKDNILKHVTFNNGLQSIGIGAFSNNLIEDLVLPTTLTNMGGQAFRDNKLPDSQAFVYARNADGTEDTTVIVSYGGANRENVIIPEGVKTIGRYSFQLLNINNIILPSSLKTIDIYAFYYNNLSNIVIPNSVNSIGTGSFNGNKLASSSAIIYGRNSDGTANTIVVSYGGTGGNVIIPNGTTSIEAGAMISSNITSITIPSTVTNIGNGAFANNQLPDNQAFIYNRNSDGSINYSSLNSYGGAKRNDITIPQIVNGTTLEEIAYRAFDTCNLTGNLSIPEGVKTIGSLAFEHCDLSSVLLPNSLLTIESMAFRRNNISSLTLGNNIQTIGDYAFFDNEISELTIPSSVQKIDNYSFNTNPLTEVRIKGKSSPSDFTLYGTNIFGWKAGYSDANIIWNAS